MNRQYMPAAHIRKNDLVLARETADSAVETWNRVVAVETRGARVKVLFRDGMHLLLSGTELVPVCRVRGIRGGLSSAPTASAPPRRPPLG